MIDQPRSRLDEMLEQLRTSLPEESDEPVELSDDFVHALLTDEDGYCSNPECWRCHSPLRMENLRRLAQNLVDAAMLCRAWELRDVDAEWWPGCGRAPFGRKIGDA